MSCFALVSIPIKKRLSEKWHRNWGLHMELFFYFILLSIMQGDGRKVWRMGYTFSFSTKLISNIPQLKWWFLHNILDITRLGLCCGLIFYMNVMSVMFCMENPISKPQFQVPFARLFIFKVGFISDLKVRCRMVCCLLCISYPIFMQGFLRYG